MNNNLFVAKARHWALSIEKDIYGSVFLFRLPQLQGLVESIAAEGLDQLALTKVLLKIAGKYDSAQDQAAAIVQLLTPSPAERTKG